MNWQALGAIGQVVGAVAVVVSLAYLAVQVRQSTAAMSAQAAHDALAAVREFNQSFMTNPAMARIFSLGADDPSSLNETELQQFPHLVFNFFKTAEALHAQFVRGTLDADTWRAWEQVFMTFGKTPGFSAFWTIRKGFFTPAFRSLYESWPENPQMPTSELASRLSAGIGEGTD